MQIYFERITANNFGTKFEFQGYETQGQGVRVLGDFNQKRSYFLEAI